MSLERLGLDMSRRDFLGIDKLRRSMIPKNNSNNNPLGGEDKIQQLPETAPFELTRKEFLLFSALTGAALILLYNDLKTEPAEAQDLNQTINTNKKPTYQFSKQSLDASVKERSEKDKKDTYLDTFTETNIVMGINIASTIILKKFGIKVGNPGLDKEKMRQFLQNHSLKDLIALGGILIPSIEEAVFRLAPSTLLTLIGQKGTQWKFGIPVAAAFAAFHNIGVKDTNSDEKKIPLSQFIVGLYFWKVMRERGFTHSLLAHATNNIEPIIVAKSLFNISPKSFDTKK